MYPSGYRGLTTLARSRQLIRHSRALSRIVRPRWLAKLGLNRILICIDVGHVTRPIVMGVGDGVAKFVRDRPR